MTHTFTPGPWHRNIRANGKYPVVFAGRNQHVATVCQQTDGAETEANIDLIAAAPELLEALVAVESTYVFLDSLTAGIEPQHTNTINALAKVRAAIKKARGEQ